MVLRGLGIDPGLRSTGIGAATRDDNGVYRSLGVRVIRTEKGQGPAFQGARISFDDERRYRLIHEGLTAAIATIKPDVIGIEAFVPYEPKAVKELRKLVKQLGDSVQDGAAPLVDRLTEAVDFAHSVAFDHARLVPAITGLGDVSARVGTFLDGLSGTIKRAATLAETATKDAAGLGQATKTMVVYGIAVSCAFTAGVPVIIFQPSDRTTRVAGKSKATKEEVGDAVERRILGLHEHMEEKIPQKTLREHAWDGASYAYLALEEAARLRLVTGAHR